MNYYFSSLATMLADRAAQATIGDLRPSNTALREYLREQFGQMPGNPGSFLGQPVFEALFEYEAQGLTLEELDCLHPKTLELLDQPPQRHAARRFSKSLRPYKHQVSAWETLKESPVKSAIVSTGTASGKTECFLIPIIDDLVREFYSQGQKPLAGVRAIFLYPLNALINSQRERLAAWTAGLDNGIRFCLYNGATPERVQATTQATTPEEVQSRTLLRQSPPPILVTNATMLEYMLVRNIDRPIIDQSKGKLRWIVLDEAHTYLGSNAAEVSLLLRRVLEAFESDPAEVHFVATSATIGSDNESSRRELQNYLADLAGIDNARVAVISGRRVTPPLQDDFEKDLTLPTVNELEDLPNHEAKRSRLVAVPAIRALREELGKRAVPLAEIGEFLGDELPPLETLKLLDYCSEKPERDDRGWGPLLPLRGHFFMRTQPGIWACWNPNCCGSAIQDQDWPFGQIFFNERDRCDDCGGQVFEVIVCKDCGETYLAAVEDADNAIKPMDLSTAPMGSDFEIELEEEPEEEDAGHSSISAAQEIQLICSSKNFSYANAPINYDVHSGLPSNTASDLVSASIASREEKRNRLRCVKCGEHASSHWHQFRPLRVGSPFYLGVTIPAMLSHTPPHTDKRSRRPYEGRQMITFSDSRQGTAKFAARMQFEAERGYVRSFIYHWLWKNLELVTEGEVEDKRRVVEALEKNAANQPILQSVLNEQQKELLELEAKLQSPTVVLPWDEAIRVISETIPVSLFIPSSIRARYSEAISDPRKLAEMYLFREFARRPRNGSSLETLGLVSLTYPSIEGLDAPTAWTANGGTTASWRDLLKLAIDYLVRGDYCIKIERDYLRWMGLPLRPRYLLPPEVEVCPQGSRRWPRIDSNTRMDQRLIRLINLALGLSTESTSDLKTLNEILHEAWSQLVRVRVFDRDEYGRRLDFSNVQLKLVSRAFQCPVTQRLLDCTLNGISPYQNKETLSSAGKAEEVDMPRLPFPFPQNFEGEGDSQQNLLEWLVIDPVVQNARSLGVWNEFSDRIATWSDYFETAEHSGQMSKSRLQSLESRFRVGDTNLLSCSTTMEMGIDIGGLTSIAMNNAPPGPANWLQRAGRAGRREIARASTLTVCQNRPHGQAVFENTSWPFTTPIHVPKVSLNSARIVQRHVNAFLLGKFLLQAVTENATKLTSQWMFLREKNRPAKCDRFVAWLEGGAASDSIIAKGVSQICRRSDLEAESLRVLLDRSGEKIREISEAWNAQRDALFEQIEHTGGIPRENSRTTPEQNALSIQILRHEDEYLLKDLVSNGFLPTHGFPLNVLPFVNTSAESIAAEQKARKEDDENLFRARSYPARQLPMAIREYAPGNSVVIDGLSYLSNGLTLHWKIPPTDDGFREAQAIRNYYWCDHCGASWSSPSKVTECRACGRDKLQWNQFLQPSGFAVDIRKPPRASELEGFYVPPTDPRLSCAGSWTSLPDPELGRFRYDPDGRVFHHSRGASGFGFAVCMRCGRSSSEVGRAQDGADVSFTKDGTHERLRSGRRTEGSHICPGSDGEFTIKRNVWLGGEEVTDVFQLRLSHPAKRESVIPEKAAVSIAVALRNALASKLGVVENELGWAVQSNREENIGYRDIYLFDAAGGGAGYVASAGRYLEEILSRARTILKCASCDRACHACLLDFDTQQHMANLDRNIALEWLDDTFMSHFRVPDQYRAFGDATRYESQPVLDSLLTEMQTPNLQAVKVVVGGDQGDWDVANWRLWRHLGMLTLSESGSRVELYLSRKVRHDLSWPILHSMVSKAAGLGISVRVVEDEALRVGEAYLACQLEAKNRRVTWGVFEDKRLECSDAWGEMGESSPAIRSNQLYKFDSSSVPLDVEHIESERPHHCVVTPISSELDGSIDEVGEKFWKHLSGSSKYLAHCLTLGAPKSIQYTDRYLRSPISARVLWEVLRSLCQNPAGESVKLSISTMESSNYRSSRFAHENWSDSRQQKAALEQLFQSFVTNVSIVNSRGSIGHARRLRITWSQNDVVDVMLDQGVGFLRSSRSVPYRFDLSGNDAMKQFLKTTFVVQHPADDLPVYIIKPGS